MTLQNTATAFTFVLLGALGTGWLAKSQERSAAERAELAEELKRATGLDGVFVSGEDFAKGVEPDDFLERTGATYKPSYNEDPDVPEQCWTRRKAEKSRRFRQGLHPPPAAP